MSVSITKRPLQPKITINRNSGGLTYVFDPFTPSYDFRLRYLECTPPYDARGGEFRMIIIGNSGTSANTNTILSNISEGNEVLIAIGKTSGTNVFRGVIETITIRERAYGYMELEISGPDWGSDLLKHRVVNGAWTQKTDATGTLDNTDNNVLISQIVSDLITDVRSYASADIAVDDQGVVYSAANVVVPSLRLPQFYANMEFLDDKLSELDAIGGTTHYIDVNKNFIMRSPTAASAASNVIVVDSYADATALTWDQTKVGLIGRESTYSLTVENHKRRLFGLGGDQVTIDQSNTTDASGTDLDANYLAQKFQPSLGWGQMRCESIGVKIKTVGTPTSDITLELVEDNGSNAPKGSSVAQASTIPLNRITSTAEWVYFPINHELNTKQAYWIILRKNGSAGNTFNWRRDTGTTGTNAYSADGVSYTTQTSSYTYDFIVRTTVPLLTIFPYTVTATDKHFHEDVIRKPDITSDSALSYFIQSEFDTLSKRKEIYKCKVYAPDTLLQTGQTVRIKKSASAYTVDNSDYVVGQLTYTFDSSDDQSTGNFYYDLEAVRFSTYS